MVTINGMSLTVEQVAAVARNFEPVQISEDAKQKINKARAYVETKLDEKAVVYGLTTGFGKFSDKYISIEDTAQLQRNLIISHSCGMGDPLPTEAVRAAMLLRCNALCRGNSGIRLSTIETLLAMLNAGVTHRARKGFARRKRRPCTTFTYGARHDRRGQGRI